jgi:hypothetical protein
MSPYIKPSGQGADNSLAPFTLDALGLAHFL